MKVAASKLQHRMPILHAILVLVAIIVVLQLWLLTATMEAFLGGEDAIVLPALLASAGCFLLNFGLLHFYLRGLGD